MKKLDIIIKCEQGGVRIPDKFKPLFHEVLDFCNKNRGGYARIIVQPPVKRRTTGEKSQSHHINGHVQQIASEIGEDFSVVKMEAKRKAISRGYPYREDAFGNVQPLSETAIDTEQAGYLIDALHEIAAFLNVALTEE